MSSVIIAGDTSGSITLEAPAASGSSVLTLPVATDTLVGKATTDTLTNKTLTSPTLTTPALGTPASADFTTIAATQAQQETGTAVTAPVTPGRQQFHPSAAKVWIRCNQNGAIAGSYNVASIADTGTGIVTVTLTTAFSSTNYSAIGSNDCGGGGLFAGASITSASVYRLLSMNTVTQSAQDSGIYFSVAFGDQ